MNLPFAEILSLVLIVPLTVMLVLNFLPELGRVYQSASRGSLFSPKVNDSQEILPDLVQALLQLRKKRIGALVVIPAVQDVDDLISGGESVDAKVNRSFILSIFNPSSPRHDGAMVIRSDRIVRVGGVLPLASAEASGEKYGTRHLAAIGLTERCDADVFVVSEEMGVISHARGGELEVLQDKDSKELTKQLMTILGKERVQTKRLKSKTVLLGMWVLALGLATFGSYEVSKMRAKAAAAEFNQPDILSSMDVPVQFINRPEKSFVVGPENATPTITVSTPVNVVISGKPSIEIDLANSPFGKVTLNLEKTMVKGLPAEAVVERIEPSEINYTLAQEREFEIKVERPATFGLIETLRIKSLNYDPKVVTGKVRDTNWKSYNVLKVLPLDLTGIAEAGIYEYDLTLNTPASVILPDDLVVKVSVEIVEK
ncbi:MAG: DNA integrity scanning protein DisA nucleotide-binding domain protein [Verrucomicrobiota bacterium]